MRCYPVWVAVGGHKVIRRGPDGEGPGPAVAIIAHKLAQGYASMGAVIEVRADGTRELLGTYIYPPAARRVVAHYEAILETLEE